MMKDTTNAKYVAIRAEFDRLVRKEYEENPSRAKFIANGYYIETIARNPLFGINDISHIRKIINRGYDRKRSK